MKQGTKNAIKVILRFVVAVVISTPAIIGAARLNLFIWARESSVAPNYSGGAAVLIAAILLAIAMVSWAASPLFPRKE